MKRWLKRHLPSARRIREDKRLGFLGKFLQDPNLWHLNRRSVAGGVALGVFAMFIPPLGQLFFGPVAAIRLRVNLPVVIGLVWVTNPLTIPPVYYLSYRIGAFLLGHPPIEFRVEFWMDFHNWLGILTPLLVGNLLCGVFGAVAGYFAVQGLWRWYVVRQLNARRRRPQRCAASAISLPSSSRQT